MTATLPDAEIRAAVLWIDAQHREVTHASYYVILGVDPQATGAQLKDAYYRRVSRLHPDLYKDALDAETRQKLVAVYSLVVEAYQILSSQERRPVYDRVLARGRLRLSADDERVDRMTQKEAVENPHARRLHALGCAALEAGNAKGAIVNFKLALSAEPQHELLRRDLARAEALLKSRGG
jgi:curved DNA-binding protein CbpA